jgi:hypothetical protein
MLLSYNVTVEQLKDSLMSADWFKLLLCFIEEAVGRVSLKKVVINLSNK